MEQPGITVNPDGSRTIQLHRYDPMTMLAPDATVLVVGERGSGKTRVMMHILYCMARKLDMCVVFCPTRDTREEFQQHVPRTFCYPKYTKEHLKRIYSAQNLLSEREQVRNEATGEVVALPTLHRIGLVFDDSMHDKREMSGGAMREVLMNGRHDNFFYLNGVQYVMDMSKDLRSQIDVVIAFPQPNLSYREPLRENVLGIFHTDEELVAAFSSLKARECLVFDQRAYRDKRQCLFRMKAKVPLPDFIVGSKAFWAMHYRWMRRRSGKHVEDVVNKRLALAKAGDDTPADDGAGNPKAGGGSKRKKRNAVTVVRVEDENNDGNDGGDGGGTGAAPGKPSSLTRAAPQPYTGGLPVAVMPRRKPVRKEASFPPFLSAVKAY